MSEAIAISALQHWSYCPRQCGLIHMEQVFDENLFTLRGRAVHETVDGVPGADIVRGVRLERSLPVWSDVLGIHGKVDLVEFHDRIPYPIDYKHGPKRKHTHDDLQLCAYAMCLEEMTGETVPRGAIYHHGSHRRREVQFVKSLREEVIATIAAVRDMLSSETLPAPVNDARCRNCSLQNACMPSVVGNPDTCTGLYRNLFRYEGT